MNEPRGSLALFTDLYELTMGSVYHAEDLDDRATFELWVRELPADRNFLLLGGVESVLEYLMHLRFDAADLEYLATLGLFNDAFLDRLRLLRFTGDAWAVPEGTVVFAGEPLLRITAPRIEAQLVETYLLTAVTFQTMIASKAARIAFACAGRPFVDFSGRRDHGPAAAVEVARAAWIAGAAGTSNVFAARQFGIPPSGTMAHSFVLSFPQELEAFRAYVRRYPNGATLLIDTYETAVGAANAVLVARELAASGHHLGAVRIDSGDLGAEAINVRRILDDAGLQDVRIFASGDLDEFVIEALLDAGAPIDAFGVGTRLGTSSDAPSLGGVYKLVEDGAGGRAKTSAGKHTLAFAKQVFRESADGYFAGDTLALANESLAGEPLLEQRMRAGAPVREPERLEDIRARAGAQLDALPPGLRMLRTVLHPYPVEVSRALRDKQREAVGGPPPPPAGATRPERPRDEFGRPLAWGSESRLVLLDYDSFSIERNQHLAIDYFNAVQFFPAHEAWEAAWRKARGTADEAYFNGLAKLGAGLAHIQRGNSHGARRLIEKAIERIAPYGPAHLAIDVDALSDDLRALVAELPPSGPAPSVDLPAIRRSP